MFWRKTLSWFSALTQREKIFVVIAVGAVVGYGVTIPATALMEELDEMSVLVETRKDHHKDVVRLARRYRQLNHRLKKLKATFDESQMTFEQVTADLDRIVKTSIGNDNYDLKKSHAAEELGLEYEKQDFTLNVKSLTLDQLVKLLHELEQGESPLFLGKVDISTGVKSDQLRATLEIASIRRRDTS